MLGLQPDQHIWLVLFDKDPILERLWNESSVLLHEIADAQYDAVVAPSYSIWLPRPRTELLYNLKRSLIVFHALQQLHVPAIPRVAWVIEHDARRGARWATNPLLNVVAVDLMTFRTSADWRRQMDGLALFDRLTGENLRYLINGPSTLDRVADVYCSVSAGRVCITNATLAPPGQDDDEAMHPGQLEIPLSGRYAVGREMAARCRRERAMLLHARRIARRRPVGRRSVRAA
jgi:hypothetical protein